MREHGAERPINKIRITIIKNTKQTAITDSEAILLTLLSSFMTFLIREMGNELIQSQTSRQAQEKSNGVERAGRTAAGACPDPFAYSPAH